MLSPTVRAARRRCARIREAKPTASASTTTAPTEPATTGVSMSIGVVAGAVAPTVGAGGTVVVAAPTVGAAMGAGDVGTTEVGEAAGAAVAEVARAPPPKVR